MIKSNHYQESYSHLKKSYYLSQFIYRENLQKK